MTTPDITQEQLQDLITQLEVNVDSIYHLILPSGMEMVGELFSQEQMYNEMIGQDNNAESFEDLLAEQEDELDLELVDEDGDEIDFDIADTAAHNDLLFLNPIKVYRDSWIDEQGDFQHTNYFLEWNPCIDGPFTHINKSNITSINKPNAETLVEYLKAVYKLYYPLLGEMTDGNQSVLASDRSNLKGLFGATQLQLNVIDFRAYQLRRNKGIF